MYRINMYTNIIQRGGVQTNQSPLWSQNCWVKALKPQLDELI